MFDDWTLTCAPVDAAWARRALLLERLLPFSSALASAEADVVVVQRWVRGHIAREARRRLRRSVAHWHRMVRLHAGRLAAARDECARAIQTAFRAYVRAWSRPRVSELLRRSWRLHAQLERRHDPTRPHKAPREERKRKEWRRRA